MNQTDTISKEWWRRFYSVCEKIHTEFNRLGVSDDHYWIQVPDLPHHYTRLDIEDRELVTPALLVACSSAVAHENGDWGLALYLYDPGAKERVPLALASGGSVMPASTERWLVDAVLDANRRIGAIAPET